MQLLEWSYNSRKHLTTQLSKSLLDCVSQVDSNNNSLFQKIFAKIIGFGKRKHCVTNELSKFPWWNLDIKHFDFLKHEMLFKKYILLARREEETNTITKPSKKEWNYGMLFVALNRGVTWSSIKRKRNITNCPSLEVFSECSYGMRIDHFYK